MSLLHALALSASKFVHKKSPTKIFTSTLSKGFELTSLTYTKLSGMGRSPDGLVELQYSNTSVGPRVKYSPRCELCWLYLFAEIDEKKIID